MIRPTLLKILFSLLSIVEMSASVKADETFSWPRFRGPSGSGIGDPSQLPAKFDRDTNVHWKTQLPLGHSSPVVWGKRIFLTGFADDHLETLCLDRMTGEVLWRATAPLRNGTVPKVRNVNSRASPTAAVDRNHVYVYFDAFGLLAYDFEGHEVWRKPLPKAKQPWGVGSSPVVAGNKLLLNVDQDIDSYLLAMDAKSGNTVWQKERPEFRRGWSTPLVVNGRVIVAGSLRLVAYDLKDGHEIWTVRGLPYQVSASPVYANDTFYMAAWDAGGVSADFDTHLNEYDKNNSGTISPDEHTFMWDFPKYDRNKDKVVTRQEFNELAGIYDASQNNLFAIRSGGQGNITESHVKWQASSSLPHVPSVLAYRGLIYTVCNGGIACCYDADSGNLQYRVRLPAGGDYFASPVASDGQIYFASKKGIVSVVKAGSNYELLHKAVFDAQIMATPVIINNTLLIRAGEFLYAIGNQQSP